MQKHLNAIRTVALICIAGKAVSVSFAGAEDGLPLSATINSLLINFLQFTLLYFSVEFAVRFFIWPRTRSIHAIAVFRKNKKAAVEKVEEPEPVKPVSPLETPKDAIHFAPTPSASAKSINPTSLPSNSKPNLALHTTNFTFAPCRATVISLRLLHSWLFLCKFAVAIFSLQGIRRLTLKISHDLDT